MSRSTITRDSRAKINLALSVGAADASGLHPISSWMTLINFGDTLTLTRLADGEASAFNRAPADEPIDGQHLPPITIDWPIESDLIFRAHHDLEKFVGRPLPVRVDVKKRIPAGAGLAGGSGNAAVMLLALRELFELPIDDAPLARLARSLGSDVSFMLAANAGEPAALVGGTGAHITPMPMPGIVPIVLIFPPFGCATGPVYQAFDHALTDASRQPNEASVKALASQSPLPQDAPFNDLAQAAFTVQPPLREIHRQLENALRLPVHVSGSGSTLFVIAPTAQTAKVLARKVTATTALPAIATRNA